MVKEALLPWGDLSKALQEAGGGPGKRLGRDPRRRGQRERNEENEEETG